MAKRLKRVLASFLAATIVFSSGNIVVNAEEGETGTNVETSTRWLQNKTTGKWEFHVYTSINGGEVKDETIKAEEKVTLEPTCKEEGKKEWTAIYNNKKVVKEDSIPAKGHKFGGIKKENVVEATCENGGSYDNVVYCEVCKEEMSRDTVKTPEYHVSGEPVKEKCSGDCITGLKYEEVVYCTVCNKELSREEKENQKVDECKPGKEVRENEVEATCEEEGSYDKVVYCTVCGKEISRDKVKTNDKLGHTPGEEKKENEVEATCEEEGSYDKVVYCTVCDKEISRDKITESPTGHTIKIENKNIVQPNCITKKVSYDEVRYCTVCDKVVSEKHVERATNKYEHEYKSIFVKESTCTKEGEEKKVCTLCGEVDNFVLPLVDHKIEEVKENEVAATCTSKGSYDLIPHCTVCDKSFEGRHIETDILPHSYNTEILFDEENEEKGVAIFECKDCDEVYRKIFTVNKTEDNFVVDKEPSCEKDGEGHYTVTVEFDGAKATADSSVSKVIPALGHKEEVVAGKAATCTATGLTEGKKCSVCGEILVAQKEIPALGHKEVVIPAKNPTYTATGLTEGKKCSLCGEILVAQKSVAKLVDSIKAKKVSSTYKVKTLKKAKKSFSIAASSKSGGKVTYKKISGSKKLKVSSTGKVTIAKKTKKGTYKMVVKMYVASTGKAQNVTIKVKVK